MGNYNQQILLHTFGMTPLEDATDWWVGLYSVGGDPFADLWSCEINVPRISLLGKLDTNANDDNSLVSNQLISWDFLPTVDVQGWFITNGEDEMDVGWVGSLLVPLNAYEGDSLSIAAGNIFIGISTTDIFTPDGGGGGEGLPG